MKSLASPTGTTIHRSTPTEWAGASTVSPAGTMTATGPASLNWSPPPLRPGRPHALTVQVWATPWTPTDTTTTVVIQGHTTRVKARTWTTITRQIDTTRPVTVTLAATSTASATVTVTTPDTLPERPTPADVLAVDAWLPIPTTALRWDIGRWERAAWQTTRPVPGTLVWDVGAWDATRWEDQDLIETWTPILGPGTRLTVSRGPNATGPVLTAQAGTLVLHATDDLNPRALGMHWGTPLRVYHWPTATLIWSGWVTDLATTPTKRGRGTTTITGADTVARLVATTRYGARPDSGRTETWRQRAARLWLSAPTDLPGLDVITTSDAPVCPTVWETSLAAHLDALAATTAGAWTVTRSGRVQLHATLPTTPPDLTLTDTHDTTGPGTIIAYTAGPSTWSASNVLAAIEATTHDAAPDQEGQWRAADRTATVTEPTTTVSWGGTTARVDVLTPSEGTALEDAARRLLRRAPTAPLLETAQWWPAHDRHHAPGPAMAHAAALDPLTPVTAIARGEHQTSLTARITHDITPTTWRTTTTLTTRTDPEETP